MIKRIYKSKLTELLKLFPVVAIIGARQVGKTTLATKLIDGEREYFNLDDIATLNIAKKNPEHILDKNSPVTIDEIQRAPELLLEIKKRVDNNKIPGKFLITGSANIELLPKLQESLAGRIVFIEMFPVTLFEQFSDRDMPGIVNVLETGALNTGGNKKIVNPINLMDEIIFGSYPDLVLNKSHLYKDHWYDGYIKTYLERDVGYLSNIRSIGDYQRVLALSSFRIANIISLTELSKECGLKLMTLKRYFNLLAISYQFYQLLPFYRNIGKRFVKTPKLYSYDSGLSAYLQGLKNLLDVERLNRSGPLIENRIVTELKALLSVYTMGAKMYFYNVHACGEIDLVIEHKGRLLPIEIKSTANIDKINLKTIENFQNNFQDESGLAIIIYLGAELLEIRDNIFLVPWQHLLL